jgi:hypothetical protein
MIPPSHVQGSVCLGLWSIFSSEGTKRYLYVVVGNNNILDKSHVLSSRAIVSWWLRGSPVSMDSQHLAAQQDLSDLLKSSGPRL